MVTLVMCVRRPNNTNNKHQHTIVHAGLVLQENLCALVAIIARCFIVGNKYQKSVLIILSAFELCKRDDCTTL